MQEVHYSLLNSVVAPGLYYPQLSQYNFRRATTIKSCIKTRQESLLQPDLPALRQSPSSEGSQAWRLLSLTPKAQHESLGKKAANTTMAFTQMSSPFSFFSFQATRRTQLITERNQTGYHSSCTSSAFQSVAYPKHSTLLEDLSFLQLLSKVSQPSVLH